ncbi:MAG TPA: response regulator transcription factor [Thermoanaerobaculia bacterium]
MTAPALPRRIRVLIVEDQTLVREGIRSLLSLSSEIEVAGEAPDGETAIERLAAIAPDVVLLDVRMPGLSGIQVLERLSGENRLPPTIVLTTFGDEALVLEALAAGAKGFLEKDVSLDGLVRAIRAVHSGESAVVPVLDSPGVRSAKSLSTDFPSLDPPDALTERERDVLRLMARGQSNREIATALSVAEGTVKNHVSSILSKLGVRDRTRAVLQAIKSGALE